MNIGRALGASSLLTLGALAASCSADRTSKGTEALRDGVNEGATATPTPSTEARVRAAYVTARQAEGANDAAYALRTRTPVAGGVAFAGEQRAMGLHTEMDARGVTLRPVASAEPWELTLRAASVGCGGLRVALDESAAPRAGETANRIDYARRAGTGTSATTVDEWYANGPLGVEQGFTLAESPCTDGDVSLEVATLGLAPSAEENQGIALRDSTGTTRVHYTDLSAVDAGGRALPAEMRVEEGAIVLHVSTRGAQFPVVIDPLAWVQTAELTGSQAADYQAFGSALAIDGDTAVIGSKFATVGSNMVQGAVYVFVQSGGVFTEEQRLVASDGAEGASFGSSVAILGDTLLVGASGATVGGNDQQGASYVFQRSGGTFTQQQELLASNGAIGDQLGSAVALTSGVAFVGAPATNRGGAAYVFTQSGTTWSEAQELVPSDGSQGSGFGGAFAVSGDLMVIGAPGKTVGANGEQGAVYVFAGTGSTWTEQAELVASDGAANAGFGSAIAISGTTIVAGASGIGTDSAGAAYVFSQSGTTWTQQQKVVSGSGAADGFGNAIAILGTTMVITAPAATVGSHAQQGVAYVFTLGGGTWTQQQQVAAANGVTGDELGYSVAVSASVMLVGDSNAAVSFPAQGAVYVFDYGLTPGSACSTAASCATGFCVDGVCCDAACDSLCQACTAALKQSGADDGACGPAKSGTNPHHDACGPDPVATCDRDGQCDGTGACEIYAKGTACASTCGNGVYASSTCGGASGTCTSGPSMTCNVGYGCNATGCNTTCAADTDCATGYGCTGGKCVLAGATCEGDHTVVDAQGKSTDCAPYTCASGQCKMTCKSVDDCVSPTVCDPAGACVEPTAAKGGDSGGCNASGDASGGAWWAAAGLVAALAGARRRRRT